MNLQQAADGQILIAAHRGVAGGNIPCNSIPAFQAALKQGADIIELDVSRSMDGVLYVFHPGMEHVFLHCDRLISDMHSSEVEKLHLVNQDHTATKWTPPHLEDVFQLLKGRCYINLDKFWNCPDDIAALVRKMGMQDQVLIKTAASAQNFDRVEEIAHDLPYMVIMREEDGWTDQLVRRKMRYVGVEALFTSEQSPICQPDYLSQMREKGLVTWVNSIVFDHQVVLSAGHSDDVAVAQSEDEGWGWLIERGFGIIQTDWPMMLRHYLKSRKLR